MSAQVSDTTETQDASSSGASPRAHGRWIALGIVVLAIMAAAAWWWVTHPDVFDPPGNLVGGPGRVGQPLLFETALYPSRDIEIVDVRPLTPPPPGVEISFHACSTPIGAARGSLDANCRVVAPVKGMQLPREWPEMHIIARVVLHEPGVYRSEGFVVTYREGLRRGSEIAGIHIKASTYRPASGS